MTPYITFDLLPLDALLETLENPPEILTTWIEKGIITNNHHYAETDEGYTSYSMYDIDVVQLQLHKYGLPQNGGTFDAFIAAGKHVLLVHKWWRFSTAATVFENEKSSADSHLKSANLTNYVERINALPSFKNDTMAKGCSQRLRFSLFATDSVVLEEVQEERNPLTCLSFDESKKEYDRREACNNYQVYKALKILNQQGKLNLLSLEEARAFIECEKTQKALIPKRKIEFDRLGDFQQPEYNGPPVSQEQRDLEQYAFTFRFRKEELEKHLVNASQKREDFLTFEISSMDEAEAKVLLRQCSLMPLVCNGDLSLHDGWRLIGVVEKGLLQALDDYDEPEKMWPKTIRIGALEHLNMYNLGLESFELTDEERAKAIEFAGQLRNPPIPEMLPLNEALSVAGNMRATQENKDFLKEGLDYLEKGVILPPPDEDFCRFRASSLEDLKAKLALRFASVEYAHQQRRLYQVQRDILLHRVAKAAQQSEIFPRLVTL